MNAERFLDILATREMVDESTITQLRDQVRLADRSITASKIAKLLVDRGRLTKFQASQLLGQMTDADTDPAASDELLIEDAGAPDNTPPVLQELESEPHGLTVLEPIEHESDEDEAEPMPLPVAVPSPPPMATVEVGEPLPPPPKETQEKEVAPLPETSHRSASLFDVITDALTRRRAKRGQQWDSMLMILGGGALLMLSLVGVLLYVLLAVGSGDELFAQAEQDYQAQLYRNAIERYERFVKKHPKHAKVSLARVRQGTSRIRATVETEEWIKALDALESQLNVIENESAFPEARPELSAILTDVYQGLVRQADDSTDFNDKRELLGEMGRALALIENPKYLPTSLRQSVQVRIEDLQEDVTKIRRDIDRHDALQNAVKEIDVALAEESSSKAYALANALLGNYPGLQRNPQLLDSLRKIPEAEQSGVTLDSAGPTPETEDGSLIGSTLSLGRRNLIQAVASDGVLYRLVNGAVYGIATNDGSLKWRRWVGFSTYMQPVPVGQGADAGALVWNAPDRALCRVKAQTGDLVWRISLRGEIARPVVYEDTALVAVKTGNSEAGGTLLQVQLADGQTRRAAHFPQGLGATPAVDLRRSCIYLPAQHSSLYVLNASSLTCSEVVYVGHADGMASVPPVVSGDNLFLVENSGEDYCRLHTFVRDANGVNLQPVGEPQRLSGQVFDPPRSFGRTVLLTSDTGGVYAFEADLANPHEPLRLYSQVRSGAASQLAHFAQLVGQRIIISGRGVSEFELLVAQGELKRKWAYGNESIHLAAPEIIGDTIFLTQARSSSQGARVEALRLPGQEREIPQSMWSLDVGSPLAVPPIVDQQTEEVTAISSGGAVWRLSADDFRAGVIDKGIGDAPRISAIDQAAVLQDGRAVVVDERRTNSFWLYDPMKAPPRIVPLSFEANEDEPVGKIVAMGQNVLANIGGVQVGLFDPDTGRGTVLPFQPALAVGELVDWNYPLALEDGRILLSTSDGVFYLVRPKSEPTPFLNEERTLDLKCELRPRLAATENVVFAVRQNGTVDTVLRLATNSLEVGSEFQLTSIVVYGPERVGNQVVISTADGTLWGFAEHEEWSVRLPFGGLAGRPLERKGIWLCASTDGRMFSVDPKTASVGAEPLLDIGEPLSSGPVEFGGRLLLSGADGTLYLVAPN